MFCPQTRETVWKECIPATSHFMAARSVVQWQERLPAKPMMKKRGVHIRVTDSHCRGSSPTGNNGVVQTSSEKAANFRLRFTVLHFVKGYKSRGMLHHSTSLFSSCAVVSSSSLYSNPMAGIKRPNLGKVSSPKRSRTPRATVTSQMASIVEQLAETNKNMAQLVLSFMISRNLFIFKARRAVLSLPQIPPIPFFKVRRDMTLPELALLKRIRFRVFLLNKENPNSFYVRDLSIARKTVKSYPKNHVTPIYSSDVNVNPIAPISNAVNVNLDPVNSSPLPDAIMSSPSSHV
ncbi:unnamed protein product [Caenorhabditis auriculariae]|uniref:Uncharacterized protein n=1 Tax=Caenorhabditis auriculariae TaxID=2777116 RepID=A0A8S1HX07_9PELO|nr:unnamed protein product [Caenorhabditis auriculariae]